jgi:hypothetical protein
VRDERSDDRRTNDGCHKPWVSSGEQIAVYQRSKRSPAGREKCIVMSQPIA